MKVIVVNYLNFKIILNQNKIYENNIETYKDNIFISIIDSKDTTLNKMFNPYSKPQFKKDYNNVLNLQFDDVTHDGENSPTAIGKTKTFTKEDAKKIIKFLKKNKKANFCLIHCAAGISRSGAVGQFVNDFFKEDYQKFIKNNPRIMPNSKIVRILNNENK